MRMSLRSGLLELGARRCGGFLAHWLLIAILMHVGSPAHAEPLELGKVPDPLRSWVDWVLHGHEEQLCPFLHGGRDRRICVWPSELELDLVEAEGRFTQRWLVYTEATLPLPGDAKLWPEDIQLNGLPAPLIEYHGLPGVRVPAGVHTVTGRFVWSSVPEMLRVPRDTGLLRLTIDERRVPFPNRDEKGRLWLRKRQTESSAAENTLDVVVHRLVADEIPLRLVTRIELRVAGRAREVVLGRALLEGFVPMSLSSPVPARLDSDGRLRAQVRPGTWTVELVARQDGPSGGVALGEPDEQSGAWDDLEVWVFDARPVLRLVNVEGASLVDPAQTTLPEAWRQLPAYLMSPGTSLRLVEKRRGDSDPAPDTLELVRSLWLDFDGGGFTVADRIDGVIRRTPRLEVQPGMELGRAALGGRDQLITKREEAETSGLEVPRGAIHLKADSRIETWNRSLPATGWKQDFSAVSGTLHLPPGWRLLHGSGVDRADPSWLNRWTLLDLFVVLVVAMAFFRLFGAAWGVLALLALALSYTEPWAPQWAWVLVLVAEGLSRVLPDGRFSGAVKLLRGMAVTLLVLVAIPFAVYQARVALYPVLERPLAPIAPRVPAAPPPGEGKLAMTSEEGRFQDQGIASQRDALEAEAPALKRVRRMASASAGVLGGLQSYASRSYAPDPDARITTGPGLPSWRWQVVDLSWDGPVESTQSLRLLLISPVWSGILSILSVLLVTGLVLCVLRASLAGVRPLRGGRAASTVGVLLILAVASTVPGVARAEMPSSELLEELRSRILEKPDCHPHCASSALMQVMASGSQLRILLDLDAAAETGVPLPGAASSWSPTRVELDDAQVQGLRRSRDGTLWLQLPPGRHRVLLEGPLPERDTVELPLPLLPHRVEPSVDGWILHGVHEDGTPEPNLQLVRLRQGKDESAAAPPERKTRAGGDLQARALPPYVHVERWLRLGLDWTLETRIERVTPPNSAVVLEIPLLPGESVTTANVRVRDQRAQVSLAPGSTEMRWTSVLAQSSVLELVAPSGVPWSETWNLDVSPIWHLESAGVPPIHAESPEGARHRVWRPWPGETLKLRITRPDGVPGATTTVDASSLTLRPGARSTDVTLALELRTSRGGQHQITLPAGAQLESVRMDGVVQPVRPEGPEGRKLSLPLRPGAMKVEIVWRESRGIGDSFRFKSSELDLGMPSVNAEVHVIVPKSRWTLLAGGAPLGPAILFWPLLVVVAGVALLLSRSSLTPLRFHHWLLLGVGLTQVPVPAGALVAGWFLALGWRGRHGTQVPGRWLDLVQLALAGLTAVALYALFEAIQKGLLGLPEMQIAGNSSGGGFLRWYQDRVDGMLPTVWVGTVPLLVYRLAMLAWALWLAQALVGWLRWGWTCFSAGELWRPLRTPRAHREIPSQP